MAAALARRTTKAKIMVLGNAIGIRDHPLRVAEEIAMLDAISGGRIEVLFLRGTPNEHKTYDTEVAKTKSMTQEGIDLILKAWRTTTPFSWEGDNYKFSTISIWPLKLEGNWGRKVSDMK